MNIAVKPQIEPDPPKMAFVAGRWYVLDSELQLYKAKLIAISLGAEPVIPPLPNPDVLRPLKEAARELGVSVRALHRRGWLKAAHAAAKDNRDVSDAKAWGGRAGAVRDALHAATKAEQAANAA